MNANGENPAQMTRPTTPADPMPENESDGEAQAEVTSSQAETIEIGNMAEADLSNA